MNEKISNKLRMEVLKGLNTVRSIKEDSQGFFDNLIDQGVQLIVQNAVPNEELHYNKTENVENNAAEDVQTADEPDELMDKLCGCSDQDFERLKKMMVEAERLRNSTNE